ncbi:MAG: DUF637 domain-containing protein [Parazoarcus communis]
MDWQQIALIHDQWDYKQSGLTQEGGAVIAIVVAIVTWGWGSSAATTSTAIGSTGTTATTVGGMTLSTTTATGITYSALGTALNAGFTTLATQASVSLINNKGDIGQTLKDLGSSDSVKQLLTSMLTAGLTQSATEYLQGERLLVRDLNRATFTERFATYTTKAVVGASVQSVVMGHPLDETLQTALTNSLAQTLTSEIGDWGKGSETLVAKTLAHAVVQCAAARVQGGDCASAALGAATAELLSPLLDGLDERTREAGFQQTLGSAIAGMGAMLVAELTGKDALTAMNAAQRVDYYNRQLHPDESKWIKDNAKRFAQEQGISEEEATQRLTQQALREVDFLWRAQLADGTDSAAKNYLIQSGQSFINELGEQQALFTAQGQQLFRPELFSDAADIAFYKQFAQSGISRSLGTGLVKELQDAGIDLKDGAISLAQAVAQDPAAAVTGLFKAVLGLPGAIKDSFIETGQALGEGAAVASSPELQSRLNAIYGVDVSSYQETLFALRVLGATTGALGAAKATTTIGSKTTEAVVKQLDKVLDDAARKTLVKSGGAFDSVGNPLLDLKQLSTDQKRVMGELFGENTVKQIIPDGQQIARMQGTGTTGIDDLYKVNRADVDYVVVEYKFVGSDTGKGSSNLGSTLDGKQGSESWIAGSGRLENAVGDDLASSVNSAMKTGRMETWVVTTRPDGSTVVEVLDSFGKPKSTDTSKILKSGINLSGARS